MFTQTEEQPNNYDIKLNIIISRIILQQTDQVHQYISP